MGNSKTKYYVVWAGYEPGVYSTWENASRQVSGFPGAKYKSFASREEAEAAFRGAYSDYVGREARPPRKPAANLRQAGVRLPSVAVDAACSGNPGVLEYRGVDTETGAELFHEGPLQEGTNNVGEFLAIVHALDLLQRRGQTAMPIYSDSATARSWIRHGVCRTNLSRTPRNAGLFERIEQAEAWLDANLVTNPILKWDTEAWGEIPADFGRK